MLELSFGAYLVICLVAVFVGLAILMAPLELYAIRKELRAQTELLSKLVGVSPDPDVERMAPVQARRLAPAGTMIRLLKIAGIAAASLMIVAIVLLFLHN